MTVSHNKLKMCGSDMFQAHEDHWIKQKSRNIVLYSVLSKIIQLFFFFNGNKETCFRDTFTIPNPV